MRGQADCGMVDIISKSFLVNDGWNEDDGGLFFLLVLSQLPPYRKMYQIYPFEVNPPHKIILRAQTQLTICTKVLI